MDAIDIIFIIVCIVVPMVGKYIDKAAKKSLPGHPSASEVEDDGETAYDEQTPPQSPYSAFPGDFAGTYVQEDEPSFQTSEYGMQDGGYTMAMDFQEEGGHMPEKKESPIVVSEAAPRETAGRIDKRKLVIYSEIMKPKFDEQADF